MNKIELFKLWGQTVPPVDYNAGITAIFQLLTAPQRANVIATMKAETLAVLQPNRDAASAELTAHIGTKDAVIQDVTDVTDA